jgi:hydroxyethylthiazole kinase
LVASDGLNACDSAGFFLYWKHYLGTTNILRIADDGIDTTTIGRISVLVNGGGNGYDDRQQYAAFLLRYRSDSIETSSSTTLSYHRQRIIVHEHQHPRWGDAAGQTQVFVDFTPQRPA